ncbi:hypothetical protein N7468_010349 [Penicillium chermesinum]|uniref:Glyoxalase-like domain-containing protein n=1 Tax=Penicillium chermesinum TaxID=63820 RepID=A0A9W9TCD1_9EURO|nr:uncharacterized protein N7468_010349 [Penicillium chermesinum]KAJ5217341.1 hypothetical protein N7468_010349 [Penicillium chermesinum]
MLSQTPLLDHIVILVSHKDLLEISKFLDGQFTLAPGGTHADGLTANKLILLPDGVYLELIAFFDDVDPERRRQHRWGKAKENTIIDWAFTLPSEDDFPAVQKRLQQAGFGGSYTDPIPGGRTKPDGTILKWAVSTPRDSQGNPAQPGSLPFWCFDRTPREKRVPYEAEKKPHSAPEWAKVVYDAILGGNWNYGVPSGSNNARHDISLSSGDTTVRLVFNGSKPGKGELLPGISFEIEGLS